MLVRPSIPKPIVVAATATLLLLSVVASGQQGATSIEVTPRYLTGGAHPGDAFRMAVEVRLDDGYHVNSEAPIDPFLIPTSLVLDPPLGINVRKLAFPEASIFAVVGFGDLIVFDEEFVIGVELAIADDVEPGEHVVPAVLRYQACNENLCYAPTQEPFEFLVRVLPPTNAPEPAAAERGSAVAELFAGLVFDTEPVEADPDDFWFGDPDRAGDADVVADDAGVLARLDDFEIVGTTGGFLRVDDFLEFIDAAESGRGEEGFFAGRGPLAIVILTLIGGLALNLTPCVLPMIPINLAIIGAGAQAGTRARGFALGSVYGLAMAAVYGILGLVVILTAGTFGTINASPWFNLGIAVLFVVLALAMFDKIVIDFSRLQSKFNFGGSSKGSFFLAFGMGAVAALLAGACVAPVVIQVIVFSSNLYATGTTLALVLPFVLGVGMALPWPVAGGGLSVMPKPGPWMTKVKHVFGVFILATAAYYSFLSYELFSQYWVDADEVAGSVQELIDEGWHASLAAGLDEALAEDKLVLVDMWATWCKNCLVMDQTPLKDPGVEARLEDYVKVKDHTEDLNASPMREVAKRFGAIGLPAYAILRPAPRAR